MLDLVLVGGGLANCLLAWRLLSQRPDLSFALLEAGPTLGGNHTWSFHGTDVSAAQLEWLWVLCTKSWPAHDLAFPQEIRRVGGGYHSITSADLHWKLMERLKDRVRLKSRAVEVTAHTVTLGSGEVVEAKSVIDGRGFGAEQPSVCGYQKFLGLDVELTRPHGLEVPLLMDTRVEQIDGFRFMYLLPWSETTLLVEDTTYANDASLDRTAIERRIRSYLSERGLEVRAVMRSEAAALPIPLEGAAPHFDRPTVGVAAGLFHATTGYSVPMAVSLADAVCEQRDLRAETLTPWLRDRAAEHWGHQSFFRLLNRMLFRAAAPSERRRIFSSFYRHTDGLIARFYRGALTPWDKVRILARGAGTVPTGAAFRAIRGPLPE